ncbi:MAG: putative SOS response-associated peptidase YedK [candidate division WS2 bacterium]|uniref:Abasic site processing protein n=1 Tax=Psychracetigena formicireducens TaxID=2986056 RepID=A0A9E2BHS5_PSYF1|nr:putative SOS response-associated peptidase YedK [Candidatus Psychracetigena formicireducens]MBT9145294.1 putative SOS response-associated peptidase YedK [Candidatus Psychracetigena formicireducens]
MCGRFIFIEPEDIYERFDIVERPSLPLQPNYNVAPSQTFPVIVKENPPKIIFMKWGLIPHWSKDSADFKGLINARGETILQKPSFKDSFRNRRCIIPTNGFYEWKKGEGKKTPYFIHLKGKKLFGFAGIYDRLQEKSGQILNTFSIITTEPTELISSIHNRMPVILSPDDESRWLDCTQTDTADLLSLLKPYKAEEMDFYQVSLMVNNPRYNSPDLIEKVV